MNISIANLSDRPEKRLEALKLITEHFPKGSACDSSMTPEQEFFLQLAPHAHQLIALETTTQKVVGTLSFRIFDFENMTVAGFGLIVTHPEARKQGISRRLQIQAEDLAAKAGAGLAVLWSDLQEFYEKLGYTIFGREHQWMLSAQDLPHWLNSASAPKSETKVLPIRQFQDLQTLYENQKIGPRRTPAHYDAFLRLSNVQAKMVTNAQGQPLAYGLMGKGRDLRHCIHEVVGESPAMVKVVAAMLDDHFKSQSSSVKLQLPVDHPLHALPNLQGPQLMALCFGKILAPEKFCRWIMGQASWPQKLLLHFSNEQYELKTGGDTLFATPFGADVLQLFVGPWHPQDFHDLPTAAKVALKDYRVPSFYFWGMDSV